MDHLRAHGDALSALAGPQKLRLALLRHGGESIKKAVRHGVILARDHSKRLAEDPRLLPEHREHLHQLHAHVRSAPPHIAHAIDRLIAMGPHGDSGRVWRDVVETHKDASGGSFWHRLWHGVKSALTFTGKHVLAPVGKEVLKIAGNAAKNELKKAEQDPVGTASKLAMLV